MYALISAAAVSFSRGAELREFLKRVEAPRSSFVVYSVQCLSSQADPGAEGGGHIAKEDKENDGEVEEQATVGRGAVGKEICSVA